MTVAQFENAVLKLEDIVIRIRASSNDRVKKDYDYQRQASGTTSVTEWLNARILPKLDGLEVSVMNGNSQETHGRTRLSTLRESYER